MSNKPDVYQMVTDKVIEALENGTVPWRMPWDQSLAGLPLRLNTGTNHPKPYRGVNVFLLQLTAMAKSYESPFWGTFNEVKERGGSIRKGEKATKVVLWRTFDKTVRNEDGDEDTETRFLLRYFNVFNADQADWEDGKKPTLSVKERTELERSEAAEAILAGYFNTDRGPSFDHYSQGRAYYRPSEDAVHTPALSAYEDVAEYYSTNFHEATHSTGTEKRLNRPGFGKITHFGDEMYSKEELVAEMGAAFLSAIAGTGTPQTVENSAAYLRSWVKQLTADKHLVVKAAAQAQKAADYVLGVSYTEEKEAA